MAERFWTFLLENGQRNGEMCIFAAVNIATKQAECTASILAVTLRTDSELQAAAAPRFYVRPPRRNGNGQKTPRCRLIVKWL